MAQKLIFITGAPGVGKSTLARLLYQRLENSVWLDGDDLWRMHPFQVTDATRAMVQGNITHCLRSFLTCGFDYVILTWVLHRQEIIDALLAGLDGLPFEFTAFTLVCDEPALQQHFQADPHRGPVSDLALDRVRQSRALPTRHIDVTDRTPEDVLERVLVELEGGRPTRRSRI